MPILNLVGLLKQEQNQQTMKNFATCVIALAFLPILSLYIAHSYTEDWTTAGIASIVTVNVVSLGYCYICYLEEKRDYIPKDTVTITLTDDIRQIMKKSLGTDFVLKEAVTLPDGTALSSGIKLLSTGALTIEKALSADTLEFELESRKTK